MGVEFKTMKFNEICVGCLSFFKNVDSFLLTLFQTTNLDPFKLKEFADESLL